MKFCHRAKHYLGTRWSWPFWSIHNSLDRSSDALTIATLPMDVINERAYVGSHGLLVPSPTLFAFVWQL